MAFTVGELVAKLKADTRDFDAGMAKAQAGIKTVEQTVQKADDAVVQATRRATAATSPYVKAVRERLETERQVLQMARTNDTVYQQAHVAALAMDQARTQSMGRMHAAAVVMDGERTRRMTLLHAEALRMNAAFDAQAVGGRRTGAAMGQMNNALRSVAVSMAGVNPLAGRLVGTLGQMALGTALMTGVLAALAALAVGWNRVGKEAREAEERLAAAIQRVKERAEAGRPGGAAAADQETIGRALHPALIERAAAERALAAAREAERLARADVMGGGDVAPLQVASVRLAEAQERFNRASSEAERLLEAQKQASAQTADAVAELTEKMDKEREAAEAAAHAQHVLNEQLRVRLELLRQWTASFKGGPTLFGEVPHRVGSLDTGLEEGRGGILTTADGRQRVGTIGVDRSEAARERFTKWAERTADHMRPLYERSKTLGDHFETLTDGVEASARSFLDLGAMGAQLGSSFIGAWIGGLTGGFEEARIVFQDGVIYTRENTKALRDLEIDVENLAKRIFQDAQVLARARMDAMDITDPESQFRAFQRMLSEQFGGTVAGTSVKGLTIENIDEFALKIIDMIEKGTLTDQMLGGISVTDLLQVVLEMEGLADAAAAAREELGGLASTVRNAPSGYKVAFRRHDADTGQAGPTTIVEQFLIERVEVAANNPNEMIERLGELARRQTRRGGVTSLGLATRGTA